MREPEVTANRSCDWTVRCEGGGGGYEICVTGDECDDGSRSSFEVKEFQWRCSAVIESGVLVSRTGCSGCTSAAIVAGYVVCDFEYALSYGGMRSRNFFGGEGLSVRG